MDQRNHHVLEPLPLAGFNLFPQSWDPDLAAQHHMQYFISTATEGFKAPTITVNGDSEAFMKYSYGCPINVVFPEKRDASVMTDGIAENYGMLPDTRICPAGDDQLPYNESIDDVIQLTELMRFHCEICGQGCPSASELLSHGKTVHKKEKGHECDTCYKTFNTVANLTSHRRVHKDVRPFQCHVCTRSFFDRSSFVKHERTHGPNGDIIKRYKCDVCCHDFVDKCGLKKHLRIHTGERPYVCDVCNKSYATSSTFAAHKRIHTGERPYKCDSCEKTFLTKSHLLTHNRIHSGERPFVCSVCSKAFADGSSFRRHEKLHIDETRFTCEMCGKSFQLQSTLIKHAESHEF